MTLVRKRKSFQSKSLVSLEDVTAYVWGQCLALLGLERPQREEAETVESQVTVGPGLGGTVAHSEEASSQNLAFGY